MNIGFIGAGRVGCTIGRYLADAGIAVEGYYSRTKESVDVATTFTKTRAFESIGELVKACDTIFVTTSDGAIENVWNSIKQYDLKGKVISHFSGSLSSDIFFGIEATGAYGCSIHPMYAFSDKFTSYKKFNNVCLTMEGSSEAVSRMNFLFAPLVNNNIAAMLKNGTVSALTGPAERNDIGTVRKHLQALDGTDAEDVYRAVGKTIVSIAKKKNPDTDYTDLENLMN